MDAAHAIELRGIPVEPTALHLYGVAVVEDLERSRRSVLEADDKRQSADLF